MYFLTRKLTFVLLIVNFFNILMPLNGFAKTNACGGIFIREIPEVFETPQFLPFNQHLLRPLEKQREYWEPSLMSNPNYHNPKNYKYIVHGVLEADSRLNHDVHPNFIDILKNPNLMPTKGIISASFITNEINKTFSNSGFILSVPKENIFANSLMDLGLPNLNNPIIKKEMAEKILIEISASNGLYSPRELIELQKEYASEDHNELAISGTTMTGSEVKVTAIFVKIDSDGKTLVSNERMSELIYISEKYQLPIIQLVEVTP